MALGALIGAYRDADDGRGGLVATLPLAGRTLIEYQARLARGAGASPIVLLVERMPAELLAAVDRLTDEGVAVQLARGTVEAAGFFAADDQVLVIACGLWADAPSLDRVAGAGRPTVLTLADNIGLDGFERVDGGQRWGGLALTGGAELADTAAMLGDWDLQSTLLRRMMQGGAQRLVAGAGPDAPVLLMARGANDLEDAERRIVAAARGARLDWVERHLTPIPEEWATERLMPTAVRPRTLLLAAAGLTLLGAALLLGGWHGWGLAALITSVPLDGIGDRLAALRMQPLARRDRVRKALGPLAALALAAGGIDLARTEAGWGALALVAAALAFFRAQQVELDASGRAPPRWIASRKAAILVALPFVLGGVPILGLAAVAIYAAGSFLRLQARRASQKD